MNKIHKYVSILIVSIVIGFLCYGIFKLEYFHFVTERQILKDMSSCGKIVNVQLYRNCYYIGVQFPSMYKEYCQYGIPPKIGDDFCRNTKWNFLTISTEVDNSFKSVFLFIFHVFLGFILFISIIVLNIIFYKFMLL